MKVSEGQTKNFTVNKHGVCTNPNAYIVYENKDGKIIVETALINGKWRGNGRYENGTFGNFGLPGLRDKEFDQEKQAFHYSIDMMRRSKPFNNKMEKAVKEQQFFPDFLQLKLF